MKKTVVRLFGLGLVLVLLAAPVQASLVVFSGADVGAGSADPRPNADAAAAAFDAAAALLGPTGLITFESAPLGSFTNLTVAPGVTMDGTDVTSNPQTVLNAPFGLPDQLYGYNTTPGGSQFVNLYGGTLTFTFASPIQAFGAYFSGLQLAGETITFDDGSTQTVDIPSLPISDGGIAFVGFTDAGKSIVSVQINVSGDIVAVDDVRYTLSNPVPEPSTLAVAGLGGLGMIAYARRLRRRTA